MDERAPSEQAGMWGKLGTNDTDGFLGRLSGRNVHRSSLRRAYFTSLPKQKTLVSKTKRSRTKMYPLAPSPVLNPLSPSV